MKKRETEILEYKKSTSELREGVISISSMLNKHKHGILYFGIKNDGTVVGQKIGMDTTSDISKAIKNYLKPRIVPEINIVKEDGKEIIKVEVMGEDLPYSAYGRYYIRSDDEDVQMTNAQLESFFLNKSYDYSKWEKELTEYGVDDVDEELLIRYVNKGNDSGRINFLYRDAKTTLTKLELLDGNYLNNAGYYLFSNKKPLTVKLATYLTDERINFSDMKMFKGNIFECIEESVKYVTNNIRWRAEIKGVSRVEVPEIPVEAFREIIVNSFAHMKINKSSSNEIYITPTRIHIYNPGSLVPGTNPEMFASGEQGSMIRNPLISTALYYNRTIDAFGTGFERVFHLCKNIGYRYRNNQFGFSFDFIRPKDDTINDMINEPINGTINDMINEPINGTINDTINELINGTINEPTNDTTKETTNGIVNDTIKMTGDKKLILQLLSKNGRHYTKKDLAEAIGKSVSTVNRAMQDLSEQGLIERVGSNKTGYWVTK